MTTPRFLADHDLNEHLIAGVLRCEPTVGFVRVREVGLQDRSNGEILEYASAEGFLVVSHDVNTMPAAAVKRLTARQPMGGLLMIQQTDPVGIIIDDLILIASASDFEEWQNQICFLPLVPKSRRQ